MSDIRLPITSNLLESAVGLLKDYATQAGSCDLCALGKICTKRFIDCPKNWDRNEVLHNVDC